ncbi:helix-turn-helix domain-containing protein [Kitasatospora hibisci]|uniref:helix-turn-helix domain-containing protein n=1 Tax=Kitasatospora hibisci TaxID=3369522 RepID=UPI0037540710
MKRLDLKKRRKSLGYSQEKFAELNGVATSTVVRWESGKTDPQPYQRPKIARLLKITPEQFEDLLFPQLMLHASAVIPENPPTSGDADDMKRRDFLGLLTITGTLVAMPPPDAGAATRRASVEGAGALNSHLWQIFGWSESKQSVYPLVRHQLGALAQELKGARTEAEHKHLCTLAGDLYQLAGEIFFDANRYTDAAHCYALAASASREAEAYDLWACAMTRHAFIELYERRFSVAAPMLSAASRVAQRGDGQLSTRYWVAAVQAEAYAGLGDLDACQEALDAADQVHALDGQIHNGGWLRFDGSRLAEERGTCYLELGRPDLAEKSLTAALKQDLSLRRRGAVLAELAALGAERGDLDQVVQYSEAAIELADRTGSGFIGKKLVGLQGRLAPLLSEGRVSALNQKITALSRAA